MKKILSLLILTLLPMLASADDNQQESLYGEWRLVGWNDGGIWFEVDTNYVWHRHMSIEIMDKEEGYTIAYSMVNDIFVGLLTLNGNEMIFSGEYKGGSTKVLGSLKENLFFEDHICDIKFYQLEGKQLKLYYTDDDYFVFTKDFDDSQYLPYAWYNGVPDHYVAEVISVSDEEVTVKTIHSPSYTSMYRHPTPTSQDVCHFAVSDLAALSFEVGDKIAFKIVQSKLIEGKREFLLKVEPCKGSEYVTDKAGMMHKDKRMGWMIVDVDRGTLSGVSYLYPMKDLPEAYQKEGLSVIFSGDLYPTQNPPTVVIGGSDFYYVSIDAIESDSQVESVPIDEAHFPDPAFRARLIGHYDWAADSILTETEVKWVRSVDFSDENIKNMKGIEYFTHLIDLRFTGKNLEEVDLSKNTELAILKIENTKLSSIDLSNNLKLSYFSLRYNQLNAIDLPKNTELGEIHLDGNRLASLDLTGLKKLAYIYISSNQIKGEAMDKLIASLSSETPTLSSGSKSLCVINTSDSKEGNVVTKSQVAAIQAKGWKVYQWNKGQLSTYLGSEPKDDYRPLVEEGKVWKYSYNNGIRQYMKSLTVSGDTIIGNQTYKKIIDVASQGVEMALREEGKKVYCCYPHQNTEYLLYDFDKNTGDIISKEIIYGDTRIRKVISVNTIMVKNNAFRCMTVHEYTIPEGMSEEEYFAGNYGYDSGFWVEGIGSFNYLDTPIPYDGNYYTFQECRIGDVTFKQKDFVAMPQNDYRPFIEEGKVWKVGTGTTIVDNSVQVVDYYYFDGDTIIGGKTCKQMMCQRYVSPNYSNEYWTPRPSLTKVGAWYEEDKKVYSFDERQQTMTLKYDFSLEANDTLHFLNVDDYPPFIIGPKQTGGIEGFKGVYRDIMMCRDEGQNIRNTTWLEGVGGLDAPFRNAYDPRADLAPEFLMSCTVGDEIIYLNDRYEDGATPESMGARKNRFDFTHTIKTKPKARKRSEEEPLLYGEYNDLKLGINLNPLDDAYQVRITDDSGKIVYEKAINAGNIVGLNIDISAYEKGRYTVTVENSNESFTGEFEAQTTGIEAIKTNKEDVRNDIYNLQGQRLSTLQKGLNIVNGQKIYVK